MADPQTSLSKEAAQLGVLSFFDLSGVALGLRASEFTAKEHTTILISRVRSADEKVSIAASRELRAMIREKLEVNGLLGSLTLKRTDDDGVEQTMQATSLIGKENPYAPDQTGHHVRLPQAQTGDITDGPPGAAAGDTADGAVRALPDADGSNAPSPSRIYDPSYLDTFPSGAD